MGVSPDESPQVGDLLVTRDARGQFILSTVPGPPQFTDRSRDVLFKLATSFATRHYVDTWVTEDDSTFTRVGQHQIATGPAPRTPSWARRTRSAPARP